MRKIINARTKSYLKKRHIEQGEEQQQKKREQNLLQEGEEEKKHYQTEIEVTKKI